MEPYLSSGYRQVEFFFLLIIIFGNDVFTNELDFSNTADFHVIHPGEEGYDPDNKLRNFFWRPNGNRGGVRFFYKTLYVVIYPEDYEGEWEQYPCARLHFQEGVLQDYVVSTMGKGFDHTAFW